jgi:hypothetical protein
MKTANNTNRDEWTVISNRVQSLIGKYSGSAPASAANTLNHRRRLSTSGEIYAKQPPRPSPRSWNETLAFVADG